MYRYRRLLRVRAALVRLDGDFDLSRSIATLDALEEMRVDAGLRGLVWDARRRTDYPSAAEVHTLVDRWEWWERVAILAGPDVQYGMARMAALVSEHIAAARTTEEALRWVSFEGA